MKKSQKLYFELGEIDEKFVAEAIETPKKVKKNILIPLIAATVAAVTLIAATFALSYRKNGEKTPSADTVSGENTNANTGDAADDTVPEKIPEWYASDSIEMLTLCYTQKALDEYVRTGETEAALPEGMTRRSVMIDEAASGKNSVCGDTRLVRVEDTSRVTGHENCTGYFFDTQTESYICVDEMLRERIPTETVKTVLDYTLEGNTCVYLDCDKICVCDFANLKNTEVTALTHYTENGTVTLLPKARISPTGSTVVLFDEEHIYTCVPGTGSEYRFEADDVLGFTAGDECIVVTLDGIERTYNLETGVQRFDETDGYMISVDATPWVDADTRYYITLTPKDGTDGEKRTLTASAYCRTFDCIFTYTAGEDKVIGTRIADGERFAIPLDGEFVDQVSGLLGSQMLHFDLKASGEGDKLVLSFSQSDGTALEEYFDLENPRTLERVRAYHNYAEMEREIALAKAYPMPDGTSRVELVRDDGSFGETLSLFINYGKSGIEWDCHYGSDSGMFKCELYPLDKNYSCNNPIYHFCGRSECKYNTDDLEVYITSDMDIEKDIEMLGGLQNGDFFKNKSRLNSYLIDKNSDDIVYVRYHRYDVKDEHGAIRGRLGERGVDSFYPTSDPERLDALRALLKFIDEKGTPTDQYKEYGEFYALYGEFYADIEYVLKEKKTKTNHVTMISCAEGVLVKFSPEREDEKDVLIPSSEQDALKSHIDAVRGFTDGQEQEYYAYVLDPSQPLEVEPYRCEPSKDDIVYTKYIVTNELENPYLYFGGEYANEMRISSSNCCSIPALNVDTAAAQAFNEKLKDRMISVISEPYKMYTLETKMSAMIGHDIFGYYAMYDFTVTNGVAAVVLNFDSALFWGAMDPDGERHDYEGYYFDIENDCELTFEQYLERMGTDEAKIRQVLTGRHALNSGWSYSGLSDQDAQTADIIGCLICSEGTVRVYIRNKKDNGEYVDVSFNYVVLKLPEYVKGGLYTTVWTNFENVKNSRKLMPYTGIDILPRYYDDIPEDENEPMLQFMVESYTEYEVNQPVDGVYVAYYTPKHNSRQFAVGYRCTDKDGDPRFKEYYLEFTKQYDPWDFIPRDECTGETYLETEFVSVTEEGITGNYAVYRDATKDELLASGTFTEPAIGPENNGRLDVGK